MLLFLLSCSTQPEAPAPDGATHAPREVVERAPAPQAEQQAIVELPEPPFMGRTSEQPTTLVDAQGQPLEVIDGIGVQVEVLRLLPDRVWVRCVGCREEREGWLHRSAVWVNSGEDEHSLLRFIDDLQGSSERGEYEGELEAEAIATLRHGVHRQGSRWLSPYWVTYLDDAALQVVGSVGAWSEKRAVRE